LPVTEREKIIQEKRNESLLQKNSASSRRIREASWAALELALDQKKCRYIGVSNYPVQLLLEMKEYARIMPAINQLEFHPKFASPELRRICKELGIVLVGYGSGTFVSILEKYSPTQMKELVQIADKVGKSPTDVILRWTTLSGVAIIPRSSTEKHQIENLNINSFDLEPEDMKILDSMNEDYPFYWDPFPTVHSI